MTMPPEPPAPSAGLRDPGKSGFRPTRHTLYEFRGPWSAEDGLLEGDLLLLREDGPRPGDVVLATVGDAAMVRRFYPAGEEVRLAPACPAGEPMTLPAAAVKVEAVVVALLRRFRCPYRSPRPPRAEPPIRRGPAPAPGRS